MVIPNSPAVEDQTISSMNDRRRPGKASRLRAVSAVTTIALASLGLGTIKLAIAVRLGWLLVGGGAVVLLSAVLALVIIGRYILGPLDAAARHRRRPTQFTMADFLALMFLFQLPVALLRLIIPRDPSTMLFLYGFAWIASSLMWGVSVQTLSRAGIATPWRRVVFLSAVLPIAYFGSVVFVGTVLLGSIELFFETSVQLITSVWGCSAGGAALLLAFYWAAWFVRTMVAHSQNDEPAQEAAAEPETSASSRWTDDRE